MENEMRSRPESDAPPQVQGFSLRELVRAQEKAFRMEPIEDAPRRRKSKRGAEKTERAGRETA
jgi:hypothetical protein